MMSKNNDNIYPNAPLAEAVFEIQFPGEPVIECRRDAFYEKIRSDFPKVLVPKIGANNAPALIPYHFVSDDESRSILLAINKLAVSLKKYRGFVIFKKEIEKVISVFQKCYSIKKINRTGLRYINIIPFTRENDLVPIEQFLNINLTLPESLPKKYKNINVMFSSVLDEGTITTKIECLKSIDDNKEALLLDFDFAKQGDLILSNLSSYLNESHKKTKQFFEDLITEEYRQYLMGETI